MSYIGHWRTSRQLCTLAETMSYSVSRMTCFATESHFHSPLSSSSMHSSACGASPPFFMNHFHQLADPRARRQDIPSLARYAQNGSPMTWEARPHIRHNVDVRLLEHYFTNHKPLRRDQLGFLSDYVSCKLDPRANPSSVKILRKDGTA